MKFINNSNDLAKLLNIKIAKDIKISNVSTDTRDLKPESLFFAIKGEKFNGNDYVENAIKKGVNFSNIYPELDGETLRNQISKTYSLKSDQIILGAGSDEVLQMIYAAFTKSGDEVIFTKYAFAMYAIYAKNFNCKPKIFNKHIIVQSTRFFFEFFSTIY